MTTSSRKFQNHDIVLINDEEYKNQIGIIHNIESYAEYEPVYTVVIFVRDGSEVSTQFLEFTIYSLSYYEEPVHLIRKLKIGDTIYLKEHFECYFTQEELQFQGYAVVLNGILPFEDNPYATLYRDKYLNEWKLINIDIPRTNKGLVNKDVKTKLAPTLPTL